MKIHVREDHRFTTLSGFLKEIVYGGNDGIVTTFAVVAGFNGASLGTDIPSLGVSAVLLFGLANLFADAASMGLGDYLSTRADKKLYLHHRNMEREEVLSNPEEEHRETIFLLQKEKGMTKEDAKTFSEMYAKYPEFWTDFMMDYELKMPDMRDEHPAPKALATFFAFMAFGAIPLLPYIFTIGDLEHQFIYSCSATAIALILLGTLRFRVTQEHPCAAVCETLFIGGISAVIAYGVGIFFR